MSLLSKSDAERVSNAVAEVEKSTAGELVVAMIGRSDDYAFHRAVLCTLLAIAGGWLLYSRFPLLAPAYVFSAQGVAWLLLWLASAWTPLVRLIVPKRYQQESVAARARQAFIEHGVTETRDRSGVLILVSEAERRVQILADRGIHARVTDAGWSQHVETIVGAVRRGETANGLCTAIRAIGEELADAFPPREDDENELSDEVVRL
jgi:putative membrane protein